MSVTGVGHRRGVQVAYLNKPNMRLQDYLRARHGHVDLLAGLKYPTF